MKTFAPKMVALVLCVGACACSQAATTAVSVLPTETKSLFTVPNNRSAVVRSVVISNPSSGTVCDQQVLRGLGVKTSLCVQGGSSFQIEFSPALLYRSNESIDLKNGDAVTTTTFTVNYRIIPRGKGLIEKEK